MIAHPASARTEYVMSKAYVSAFTMEISYGPAFVASNRVWWVIRCVLIPASSAEKHRRAPGKKRKSHACLRGDQIFGFSE